MTVNVYSSFDAGAPSLTGEVGSLIAVLDACLVTGYGAKAPAGWTKPFVGTNVAVFRQGAGAQSYFQVKDDGVEGTNGAKGAQVYIYGTMTDATTGTGKTPTTFSTTYFNQIPKSVTLDSATREWKIYASNKACYVLTRTGVVAHDAYHVSFFGDYNMINPGYGKASIVVATNASAMTGNGATNAALFLQTISPATAADSAFLLNDGITAAKSGGLLFDNANVTTSIGSYRNGAMVFSPVMVRTNEQLPNGSFAILGFLPGAFTSYTPFAGNNTVIEFTNGVYAGRSFTVATGVSSSQTNYSCIYIETTPNAW